MNLFIGCRVFYGLDSNTTLQKMSATTTPVEISPPLPPSHYLPSGQFLRGINWPALTDDWETRLEALDRFEPREDDIFVISFPKCGNHWSHEFLSMIIHGDAEAPKGE